MISARMALLRQAQQYFHELLLGAVKWDDVMVDKPIPIPSVNGHRDQGRFRDLVVANFDGFRMTLMGPFEDEDWPMGCVKVTRGPWSIEGPLDAQTWKRVATFVREQKQRGDSSNGTPSAGGNWGR